MIFTTKNKPLWWQDQHYSHVRIEVDLSDKNNPLQRHIWTYHDGREWSDGWIRSIRQTPEQLIRSGMTRMPSPPSPQAQASEIETLKQQLAECQARLANLDITLPETQPTPLKG